MSKALRALRTRWRTVTVLTLLGLLISAVIVWQLPDRYTATARLLVLPTTADVDGADAILPPERVATLAELLAGEGVTAAAAEALGDDVTARDLALRTTARVIPDTDLLEVTVTAADRATASDEAGAIAEQFVERFAQFNGVSPAGFEASIVEPARAAPYPDWGRPALVLVSGLTIGLVIGAVVAVSRQSRDRTIKGPTDLAETVDTALLGAIVYDRSAPQAPLITGLDRQHPRVESYRILRTNLQFTGVDDRSRVIVVSSALAGEGKSTTVANLAIVTAQAGQRVAVVEGDLRRPKIAEYLGVPNDVGVTTVLVGRVDLDAALQPGRTPGLEVLASGRRPPNPAELVQTQAMRDLLANLRERFDVVLIDTPPLLPVTDAAVTAALADGVVLVVQHGKTRHEELKTALARLGAVDARLLGTVLNMAPSKSRQAYGAGYFGYGYEYAADYVEQRRGGARRAT